MTAPDRPPFPFLRDVLTGQTSDVYFLRTRAILDSVGEDPLVGMEVFAGRAAVCCGTIQVAQLLSDVGFRGEVWSVSEGQHVEAGEPAMEIFGRYCSFGIYETAILGALSSSSGWASAAREVVDAAGDVPVVSFGARHVHPNVSSFMDYAAVIGGAVGCSTPLGAALTGTEASGTMPHAYVLIMGDTVRAAKVFDDVMPPDIPRIVLVDTFQDEAVESLRVAEALSDHLQGIRLDTPSERGGVTPSLVKEVRARLDLGGFGSVQIGVSGGVTPDRIRLFRSALAPVDSFGVGSYISGALPVDYTADIREIDGKPVAKRGRIPGMKRPGSLRRVL